MIWYGMWGGTEGRQNDAFDFESLMLAKGHEGWELWSCRRGGASINERGYGVGAGAGAGAGV